MLIWIFILLSIIISFYILSGRVNLISGKFCLVDSLWAPGFSLYLLNPFLFLVSVRVFVVIYIWMISWSWFAVSIWQIGHYLFCTSYCFILVNILINQIWTSSESALLSSRTVYDTVDMSSVSMPSDKLFEIQLLAHHLLHTQLFRLHQVMCCFWQGQYLCEWTSTTLPTMLCHSEWHV